MTFNPEQYYWQKEEELKKEGLRAEKDQLKEIARRIDEARPELFALGRQLQEPFSERRWAALVGEDQGGRLPLLLLGRLATQFAKTHDLLPPQRLFLSGGKRLLCDSDVFAELDKHVKDMKQKLQGQRVLLVTEFMSSGASISALGGLFKKHGIPFDIASVSIGLYPHEYKSGKPQAAQLEFGKNTGEVPQEILKKIQVEMPDDTNIYYGTVGGAGLLFYHPSEPQGTLKTSGDVFTKRNPYARQNIVQSAREKIYHVADEIFEELNAQHEQQGKAA